MTWQRFTCGLFLGLLLIAGPGLTAALPFIPTSTSQEDDDDGAPTELTLAVDASVHARRMVRHKPVRLPLMLIRAHRHHAVPVRPQAAPISFLFAANSPLHC
jgi:hypothetical protein